jgi:hypothetical protein
MAGQPVLLNPVQVLTPITPHDVRHLRHDRPPPL